MAKIALDNVRVDIPIFNSQGRSLKKAVLGFATGGQLSKATVPPACRSGLIK